MEQKRGSSAEATVCSSPQQGRQPLGASDLAPMESPRSPVAGRPLGVEGELSSGKLWGLPGQQLGGWRQGRLLLAAQLPGSSSAGSAGLPSWPQ